MNTETLTKIEHSCRYCNRSFQRESSLAVHLCEAKKRHLEQHEVGVQLGLQAYLRFYEITQGSAKSKTFDDFARSPYYRAFVKFGRYCVSIRAVNTLRFIEWVVRQNKKIDYWCKDVIYTEYLTQYLKEENVVDALARAVEQSMAWEEETGYPAKDYLRHGNSNLLCYAISSGRVSAWVLYNSASGLEFLERINKDQIAMIWSIIDADFWQKRFQDYPEDQEYARDILLKAGW